MTSLYYKKLRGQRFSSPEDTVGAFKNHIPEMSENRRGKTNTNIGRTSKHFEYDYAKKCQTFLWNCQIVPGNTRISQICSSLRIDLSDFKIIIDCR